MTSEGREATCAACGNDLAGDNLCMVSACQWEGTEGREPTRSLQETAEELGIPPEEIPTVDPATFRSWQEGREASAEKEGRVAYQAGVPQHQNPYAATFAQSEARLAWLTGWLAAEGRKATEGYAQRFPTARAGDEAREHSAGRETTWQECAHRWQPVGLNPAKWRCQDCGWVVSR